MKENILKNGNKNLTNIEGGFIVVGTSDINVWTDGKPFVVSMDSVADFIDNGFTNKEYEEMQSMKVGETRSDFDYEGNYKILWEKYQALEKSQNGTGITCQPTGTGYFQMDVNNSLMVFPSQFGYPNSTSGVPGYTITFNEGLCSLNAQSGWEITAVQSVLYTYNKEQMIQGQFSPGKLNKEGGSTEADKDALQAYIKSWFETASTDYTFSDIYLGDSTKAGVSGRCTVQIDGQSYVINCGMVSDGKTVQRLLTSALWRRWVCRTLRAGNTRW